ncbi:Short-chain dehydrogenase/reductase family protein [Mycena sanguinolenta]|uniref:Short-chain dehydrogenase/reductase family protein n=1 Tax=Mycena sanguinolenta TaxID=230812 RepID=A0A8H6Z3A2_9AGAR|nr:Short-chain dehydrogenase/reductase family protein [Mycena sanguinolenta]
MKRPLPARKFRQAKKILGSKINFHAFVADPSAIFRGRRYSQWIQIYRWGRAVNCGRPGARRTSGQISVSTLIFIQTKWLKCPLGRSKRLATALVDQITGKNVLVTGSSINGLGFETARAIAKHANLVIITGYNAERLKLSEDAIKKEIPSANIRCLKLDLSSMVAVRAAAAEVHAYTEPLHVLINNAATAIGPFKLTVDGLESQIATNYVGHFLLTTLLAPKLLASKTASFIARIVRTACIPASSTRKGTRRPQVSLTRKTLTRTASPLDNPNAPFKFKTIPQGAATSIVAAFDPRIADKPGAYLVDCVEDNAAVAPHASDPVMAEKLWMLTEKLIGQSFAFP